MILLSSVAELCSSDSDISPKFNFQGRFNSKTTSSKGKKVMTKITEDNNDQFPQLGNVYRKASGFGQANFCSKNVAAKSAQGWDSYESTPSAWKRPNLMQKHKEKIKENEYEDDDDEVVFGSSDDDDLSDCDLELERSDMSHESRKTNKRFRAFFVHMDNLAVEALNSIAKKWHCPVCKGGRGAIDCYRGLAPLMHHATTIKTRRVKLHRLFADVLNEEGHRRRIVIAPIGVATGRWEGLNENVTDHQIVWPPTVVIVNTRCELMENGKWIGMGNQELLDHFHSFAARKARHAYGPKGHRGISVLIFDDSAAGYYEAERLGNHLKEQGRGRDAWVSNKVPRFIAGRRQLFGYMASKEDMNDFNQHCQGKLKLKFEMRSHQEVVETHINQMNENIHCKEEYERKQKHVQVLAETVITLSQKLHKASVNNRDMRQRTVALLKQNKEELDSQDEFFKEQLKIIHQAIDEKEDNFEKLRQTRWANIEQPNSSRMEDESLMKRLQEKEIEEFEEERKKLVANLEGKKDLVMKRCREELLELEKEFQNQISQLMEKYNKDDSAAETSHR